MPLPFKTSIKKGVGAAKNILEKFFKVIIRGFKDKVVQRGAIGNRRAVR
jgi:hypothetical protein